MDEDNSITRILDDYRGKISRLRELFDIYSTQVDTECSHNLAGEIVRATMTIYSLFVNQGERIAIGHGNRVLNPPARYLINVVTDKKISDFINYEMWGEEYSKDKVYKLTRYIVDYIDENPCLKKIKNNRDMWEYTEDIDDSFNEDYEYGI